MTEPRSWDWYAARFPDDKPYGGAGEYHSIYPVRSLVKMCGIPSRDILPVTLTEDPDGKYLTWILEGKDEPSFVYPEPGYSMCFPYGRKAAEESGDGVTVALAITPRTEDQ